MDGPVSEASQSVIQETNSSTSGFSQPHIELVLTATWWWIATLVICVVALLANSIFLVTIVYNRKRQDLQTFVTAVIVTVAVLDIVDVLRIFPVLIESLYLIEVFRHIYCSLGVFHELAVAMFIISIGFYVCFQAGKESKFIEVSSMSCSAWPQKVVIGLVLLLSAAGSGPFFLLAYDRMFHTCVDPFRVQFVTDVYSDTFAVDFYATLVTVITYVLPIVFAPIILPLGIARTCISKQCCVQRYKQPIGELIMVSIIYTIYLVTIVGVMLPRFQQVLNLENVVLGPAPLIWELGNNALRPICYFLTNPGVWDGLKSMCCKKRFENSNGALDDDDIEVPLRPITSV